MSRTIHPKNNSNWGWGHAKSNNITRLAKETEILEKIKNQTGAILNQGELHKELEKNVVSDVIEIADKELQLEFKQWLAGKHACNKPAITEDDKKSRMVDVMYAITGHERDYKSWDEGDI
jgi:hypothetical protein